ncbi:MAG TPA: hypothetical protein VFR58_09790 [Flavisolibacter sp.]|nr:hypothetical protein [Flavisolibacter sp.]
MRKYLLFLLLLGSMAASGQNLSRRNTVYAEAFGNGIGIMSVNYEHQPQGLPGLGFRLGLGYFADDGQKFRVSVPAGINYLFPRGRGRYFIDAGAGITWSNASGLKTYEQELRTGSGAGEYIFSFVPSIGFRQHIINEKVMWRFSFSGIINKYRAFPFAGIAAGFRF